MGKELLFGSLFAGIGGIDLGLERAGMQCRWQVEIDDYRRSILERHWPDVRRHADIHTWPLPDTERVDLICAGVPCQPVSVAGKRRGSVDDRWLWDELFRVVRALRPRYVFAENPLGLLSMGFTRVLSGLAELGYDAEWQVLSAVQFGAPHLRRRVWVVAYASDGMRPKPLEKRRRADPSFSGDDGKARDAANANCDGRPLERQTAQGSEGTTRDESGPRSAANSNSARLEIGQGIGGDARPQLPPAERGTPAPLREWRTASDTNGNGRQGTRLHVFAREPRRPMPDPSGSRWWPTQPPVRARDDGLPAGLARRQIEAIGNSVCIPVVEWIGRRIMEFDRQ